MARRKRSPAIIVEEPGYRRALSAILLGGLLLRLLLTPAAPFKSDAEFFRAWGVRLVELPPWRFYDLDDTAGIDRMTGPVKLDHLPGDLWIHWLIAQVYRLFSPDMDVDRFAYLFLLKLVPSLADAGIGLMLYLIALRLAGPRAGLLAAALYMFNPGPIFLSAVWGQWDSVSTLLMLVALWLALRGTAEWSLPVLTYACLIKPQLALLFPLLAIVWWRRSFQSQVAPEPSAARKRRLQRLGIAIAASLAVFLVVSLPFNVGVTPLPTRWTIFERVSIAVNAFEAISANAYNLWRFIEGREAGAQDNATFLAGLTYRTWGTLLLIAALALIFTLFWRRTTQVMLLWAALATTFSLFMLPTRIHERYLLPAVALAVLCAAILPRLRWPAVGLSLTYFANLYLVYRVGHDPFIGTRGDPPELLARLISAANTVLWITVLAIGVSLASRSLNESAWVGRTRARRRPA